MKQKLILIILAAVVSASILACTKTMELPGMPQNEITAYKVVNLPDTVIYGAIDNIENTITVYVPFYYNLSVIDPQISVSDGAKITERVMPVSVTAQNVKYTIAAADGTTKTYALKIVNQSIPSLEVRWAIEGEMTASPVGTLPPILGNFQSRNVLAAGIELTNRQSGKSVNLSLATAGLEPYGNDYQLFNPLIPATIDTGYYDVKVSFAGHTALLPTPVHMVFQQPNLLIPAREAKQGGEISFDAFNSVFVGLKAVTITVNSQTYTLEIVSVDRQKVTLKLPDDFPAGVYNYTAVYKFEFDGWPVLTKYGALTVIAK